MRKRFPTEDLAAAVFEGDVEVEAELVEWVVVVEFSSGVAEDEVVSVDGRLWRDEVGELTRGFSCCTADKEEDGSVFDCRR